jgi:hypothetical protein
VTGSYPDAPASMRRPPRATHGSSARPGADARADAKPGHSSRRKGLTPAHPYLCRARPRAACAARPRSNKTPSTMSAPFKADGRLLLRSNEISSTPRMAIHTLGEPHPPHLILIWQGPPLLPYALSRPGLTARRISPLMPFTNHLRYCDRWPMPVQREPSKSTERQRSARSSLARRPVKAAVK